MEGRPTLRHAGGQRSHTGRRATRRTVPIESTTVRRLFGPVFIFAGIMHFVIPREYESIVPDYLPARRALVYISGVAEIAGGVGLLHPRTRRLGSWWSIATLIAVFPANVHMAVHAERYRTIPGGRLALIARLPFQALFVAWARAARI
jgi:uncharacterized membrane protein